MKTKVLSAFFVIAILISSMPIKALAAQDTVKLDVPFIDQRQSYPSGCESVSAVMALKHCGVAVSVDEFIDKYLPIGNAPYYYN